MDILFPHDEYRKIQKGMVRQVYEAIKNKHSLLIHAPTGVGKTAASLASALTFAMDNKKTVFFLTSRNTQHKIAIETLKKIKLKHNKPILAVDLLGKKWMCNQPASNQLKSSEFAEYCKDLREKGQCKYFSNLKKGNNLSFMAKTTLDELKRASPSHTEEINNICFQNDVCSFETACLLAKKAHVIVADYNQMLNPSIRANLLQRINKDLDDIIIICDEAHNLPGRARHESSAKTSTFSFELAAKEMKKLGFKKEAEDAEQIQSIIFGLAKDLKKDEEESLVKKQDFIDKVDELGLYEDFVERFNTVADKALEEKKRSFSSSIANFMDFWQGQDEGFVRYVTKEFDQKGEPRISLHYNCLDPGFLIKPLVEQCFGFIAMSGTLTPLEMYCNLFGIKEDKAIMVNYDNPFPKDNRLTIIVPEGTTQYKARSVLMYELLAKKILQVVHSVPGNCAVFFPSYFLMNEIGTLLQTKCEKTMFFEESGMNNDERLDLLERFKEYKDTGAVLFGVSAGSFGEGIDLIGDFLKSVIIVGLPLAKPDLETKELISYYDRRFGKGWDYGYVYPAIIKTLQNAGRCIRSEDDKGVIVFLDERYVWKNYFNCFPVDWNMVVDKNPDERIKMFFS